MTPTSQVKRMKKNDLFSLKITDMGVDGEGIGKYDGMTFFVKDALIGDEIRARATKLKKHYGYARVEEIITPSPYRSTAAAVAVRYRHFPTRNSLHSRKTRCAVICRGLVDFPKRS